MGNDRFMLGVIGGSGLYDFSELADVRSVAVDTPFGAPSDEIVVGQFGGVAAAFLPRHGRGHRLSPSELPYRANLYALKSLGVTHVVSVSAVGSLQEGIHPRSVVLADQLIDRTLARPRTFFEGGMVAHVGIADPFCPHLREALRLAAGKATEREVHPFGTYVCIEGPQFSTRAESHLFRSWGASVIGMTAMPEARLAREAELCYATMAMVTDYDVWHESEADVSVELVMSNLQANVATAQALLRGLVAAGLPERSCRCVDALTGAFSTDPERVPRETRERLGIIADRYLPPVDG